MSLELISEGGTAVFPGTWVQYFCQDSLLGSCPCLFVNSTLRDVNQLPEMFTAAETIWFKTDSPKQQSWSLPRGKGRPKVSLQQWHFKQLFESHATKSSQRKGKGTALKGFPTQKITSPQRRHERWEKITAMACDKNQQMCQEHVGKVSGLGRKP